jgi:four helix bundle protein
MGSASELENHLELGLDLGFLSQTDYDELQRRLIEVKRMLASLIQRTRGSGAAGR